MDDPPGLPQPMPMPMPMQDPMSSGSAFGRSAWNASVMADADALMTCYSVGEALTDVGAVVSLRGGVWVWVWVWVWVRVRVWVRFGAGAGAGAGKYGVVTECRSIRDSTLTHSPTHPRTH